MTADAHMTCAHGRTIGGTQIGPGGYFGGVGTCQCCQQKFGFCHSSTHDRDGLIESSTQDETLCKPCGGRRVEYLHPDYERVELSPKVFTVRRKVAR